MKKTAYIVEDEDNIREIVKCAAESCGISVAGFRDAGSMLKELGSKLPDLILLDIMLPGMDGLETLKRLKSAPATASVPVILLTAKSSETDKVTGLDLGADDYITKPFGILELMARIRAALRHAGPPSEKSSVYELKGLVLDTVRHEVTLNGSPVELTLKEFDLLRLLMENPGKVLLRNTLLDTVWGYGYMGETRTLDMHIRSLRQKIGDAPGKDGFISTIRGVGYKFNDH